MIGQMWVDGVPVEGATAYRDDEQLPGHRRRRVHGFNGGVDVPGGAQDIDASSTRSPPPNPRASPCHRRTDRADLLIAC
jgi:hypothetical protein